MNKKLPRPKADQPLAEKQSPQIYRYFTEWYVWPLTFSVVMVILVSILGLRFLQLHKKLEKVIAQQQAVQQEVDFWEKVVTQYPDYRDAYFKLALLEYQLNNTNAAKGYLEKSLELDPNFEKGRELEKVLQ